MQSRKKSVFARGLSKGNRVDRRRFLTGLAALGGAANLLSAAEPARSSGPAAGGRGKVQDVRGEIKEYKDPKTGACVRRLTGDGSSNVHPYFTSWAFVGRDADHTVFISNRTGAYQWHLLNIPAARLVQLTAGQKILPNMACLARSGRLFYFDGPVLHSVATDTLADRELYRVPAGFQPSLPTCTADGRYLAFAYCQETALSTETGRIYATMHERYYQHPHSVVMRIDTESGQALAAWGEATWISHVLIHPTQPNLILFCHEGGGTCVQQRMWIVDLNHQQARKAAPSILSDRVSRACMSISLSRATWVSSIRWIAQAATRSITPSSGPTGRGFASISSLVAVRTTSSPIPTTAWWSAMRAYLSSQDKEGGQYLGLMTHLNGRVRIRRLAWHGTSWRTQESHGHPSFSPDDRWVIYNSDAGKCDNVYMADVQSI